ncbi:MAG TPA: ATP synthase subunit I [Geobacteraceae bacterium]|nr:ATP synthase subunit I [Geobacteraceae bacterium]
MTTVKINENNIFTVLTAGSLALLVLLAVVGFLFGSVRFALSVLAGGVLAIANFYWLRSILVRAFRLTPEQAPRFALFRYVVRLAVLAAVVFVLIVTCRADVFGLLLGLSVLVLNIMALSFYMMSAKGD